MPVISKQTATSKRVARTGGVVDRIAPIGFDSEGIKMLLYGESGTGKTTFWATAPGPILAVVCSGGNQPGELRSVDTPEYRKKISQVTIASSDELRELIPYVRDSGKFATVVLDHASGLQDLILKELLGLEEIPVQKSFGLASMQIYAQCAQMCKEYLRGLLSTDLNVVIVAHQRTFGGKDDGMDPDLIKPTVGAGMVPSLTSWINGACDYIVQTFKKEKWSTKRTEVNKKIVETRVREKGIEYALRTGPHEVYYTKFRVPRGTKLPEYIVDPDFDKVSKLIHGG